MPPVTHKLIQRALFGGGTVPGLRLDGRWVLGSRAIVRALDERVPDPRLVPADDKERKAVELAEGWGDEVLQPLVPRVRLGAPLVARAGQRVNRATDPRVRADLASLEQHLARVERWIEHEVIGGEAPNAAD